MVNNIKDLFKDVSFILKFVVFLILVLATCFAASRHGLYATENGTYELLTVAVYTFVIIFIGLLALYLFAEPHRLYNLVYLIVGGVLNVILGVMCLMGWGGRNKHGSDDGALRTLLVGVFALAAGIIMIVDFVLTLLNKY